MGTVLKTSHFPRLSDYRAAVNYVNTKNKGYVKLTMNADGSAGISKFGNKIPLPHFLIPGVNDANNRRVREGFAQAFRGKLTRFSLKDANNILARITGSKTRYGSMADIASLDFGKLKYSTDALSRKDIEAVFDIYDARLNTVKGREDVLRSVVEGFCVPGESVSDFLHFNYGLTDIRELIGKEFFDEAIVPQTDDKFLEVRKPEADDSGCLGTMLRSPASFLAAVDALQQRLQALGQENACEQELKAVLSNVQAGENNTFHVPDDLKGKISGLLWQSVESHYGIKKFDLSSGEGCFGGTDPMNVFMDRVFDKAFARIVQEVKARNRQNQDPSQDPKTQTAERPRAFYLALIRLAASFVQTAKKLEITNESLSEICGKLEKGSGSLVDFRDNLNKEGFGDFVQANRAMLQRARNAINQNKTVSSILRTMKEVLEPQFGVNWTKDYCRAMESLLYTAHAQVLADSFLEDSFEGGMFGRELTKDVWSAPKTVPSDRSVTVDGKAVQVAFKQLSIKFYFGVETAANINLKNMKQPERKTGAVAIDETAQTIIREVTDQFKANNIFENLYAKLFGNKEQDKWLMDVCRDAVTSRVLPKLVNAWVAKLANRSPKEHVNTDFKLNDNQMVVLSCLTAYVKSHFTSLVKEAAEYKKTLLARFKVLAGNDTKMKVQLEEKIEKIYKGQVEKLVGSIFDACKTDGSWGCTYDWFSLSIYAKVIFNDETQADVSAVVDRCRGDFNKTVVADMETEVLNAVMADNELAQVVDKLIAGNRVGALNELAPVFTKSGNLTFAMTVGGTESRVTFMSGATGGKNGDVRTKLATEIYDRIARSVVTTNLKLLVSNDSRENVLDTLKKMIRDKFSAVMTAEAKNVKLMIGKYHQSLAGSFETQLQGDDAMKNLSKSQRSDIAKALALKMMKNNVADLDRGIQSFLQASLSANASNGTSPKVEVSTYADGVLAELWKGGAWKTAILDLVADGRNVLGIVAKKDDVPSPDSLLVQFANGTTIKEEKDETLATLDALGVKWLDKESVVEKFTVARFNRLVSDTTTIGVNAGLMLAAVKGRDKVLEELKASYRQEINDGRLNNLKKLISAVDTAYPDTKTPYGLPETTMDALRRDFVSRSLDGVKIDGEGATARFRKFVRDKAVEIAMEAIEDGKTAKNNLVTLQNLVQTAIADELDPIYDQYTRVQDNDKPTQLLRDLTVKVAMRTLASKLAAEVINFMWNHTYGLVNTVEPGTKFKKAFANLYNNGIKQLIGKTETLASLAASKTNLGDLVRKSIDDLTTAQGAQLMKDYESNPKAKLDELCNRLLDSENFFTFVSERLGEFLRKNALPELQKFWTDNFGPDFPGVNFEISLKPLAEEKQPLATGEQGSQPVEKSETQSAQPEKKQEDVKPDFAFDKVSRREVFQFKDDDLNGNLVKTMIRESVKSGFVQGEINSSVQKGAAVQMRNVIDEKYMRQLFDKFFSTGDAGEKLTDEQFEKLHGIARDQFISQTCETISKSIASTMGDNVGKIDFGNLENVQIGDELLYDAVNTVAADRIGTAIQSAITDPKNRNYFASLITPLKTALTVAFLKQGQTSGALDLDLQRLLGGSTAYDSRVRGLNDAYQKKLDDMLWQMLPTVLSSGRVISDPAMLKTFVLKGANSAEFEQIVCQKLQSVISGVVTSDKGLIADGGEELKAKFEEYKRTLAKARDVLVSTQGVVGGSAAADMGNKDFVQLCLDSKNLRGNYDKALPDWAKDWGLLTEKVRDAFSRMYALEAAVSKGNGSPLYGELKNFVSSVRGKYPNRFALFGGDLMSAFLSIRSKRMRQLSNAATSVQDLTRFLLDAKLAVSNPIPGALGVRGLSRGEVEDLKLKLSARLSDVAAGKKVAVTLQEIVGGLKVDAIDVKKFEGLWKKATASIATVVGNKYWHGLVETVEAIEEKLRDKGVQEFMKTTKEDKSLLDEIAKLAKTVEVGDGVDLAE